jgi:hypothetical protein
VHIQKIIALSDANFSDISLKHIQIYVTFKKMLYDYLNFAMINILKLSKKNCTENINVG